MSTLTGPSRTFAEQHAFNRQVWERLIEDLALATFEGKVETDRDGNLIMSPPPEWPHPTYANAIAKFLDRLLPEGGWLVEASVSTPEGVKIPDVAWYGPERAAAYDAADERVLGAVVPDLCVEVQ